MKILYSFIFITFFFVSSCFSYFWNDTSVVNQSLGGAVNLIDPDVSMTFTNPALVNVCDRSHITGSYWLLNEARYNFFGYLEKSEGSGFSISGVQLFREGIEIRQNLTDSPTFARNNQSVANFCYSAKLFDFNVGTSLKYFNYEIYDYKADGYGIDLGLCRELFSGGSLLKHKYTSSFDFSIQNALQPVIRMIEDRENLPRIYRAGFNINMTLFPSYDINKVLLKYHTASLFIDTEYDNNLSLNTGLQYSFDPIDTRIGFNKDGSSFGLGFKVGDVVMNYTLLNRYSMFHYFDITYKYGDTFATAKTPDELEEYRKVLDKAQRLYDKNCNTADSLINDKKYSDAKTILIKTLPLAADNKKATDLLNVCEMSLVTENISILYKDYQKNANNKSYAEAFSNILKAIDIDSESNITISMIGDIKNRNSDYASISSIKDMESKYIANANSLILKYVSDKNYIKANETLKKMMLLELTNENTILQKNLINDDKAKYTDSLVKKAIDFTKIGEYPNAVICFREAFRVSGDQGIKMQLDATKKVYLSKQNYDLPESLYQRKLYSLSATALANDENDSVDYFVELKKHNVAYDYDNLENTLVEAGKISRNIP